jgi:hypothetical protein
LEKNMQISSSAVNVNQRRKPWFLDAEKLQDPKYGQWALWGGIAFSFAFTLLIWLLAPRLEAFPKLPDQGASWYFWKLADPTFITRFSAWSLYAIHQVALWGLIYYAQTRVKKYTSGLHPVNVAALGLNALFVVLHLVQSHLFYDGLAQDVSIFSSQGSVILMLVWILLMENKRRGMFFGKKAPISKSLVDFARRYHGYVFAWAIVYTFWYHPTEGSLGHLIGFAYTFLLLLQGSLFLTRIHVNKWWMLTQELTVAVHGTLVAIQQGQAIWPMFLFGFAAIFVVTQMWGLGLSKPWKIGIITTFVVSAGIVYWGRPLTDVLRIAAIPAIEYLAVGLLMIVIGIPLAIYNRRKQSGSPGATPTLEAA